MCTQLMLNCLMRQFIILMKSHFV